MFPRLLTSAPPLFQENTRSLAKSARPAPPPLLPVRPCTLDACPHASTSPAGGTKRLSCGTEEGRCSNASCGVTVRRVIKSRA